MSTVALHEVGVSRAGRVVLADVSLAVQPGELHVLLGPNGAGKSSLLQAISGEWPAEQGEIRLHGKPLSALSARAQAQQRAVLPQHDALSFGFTVSELVALGRHAAGDQRAATERAVVQASLQATDIVHLAARRYVQLSGGERRRAQLARVLAQVWDVPGALLLLDEPTHSLDIGHQHAVMTLLRKLADEGFVVLASLHDLNLTAAYAHRVSLLAGGRLLASGTPAEVLQPHNLQSLYGDGLEFQAVADGRGQQWLTRQRP